MKVKIANCNIVEYEADALIYSTNQELFLGGGGVGAALIERHGFCVQDQVFEELKARDVVTASVGDVIETAMPGMPWKKIFHTVVSNEHYNTEPNVVSEVIKRCLARCEETAGVQLVAISALGCGYGDLSHTEFVQLIHRIAAEFDGASTLKEIIICCKNNNFYREMLNT